MRILILTLFFPLLCFSQEGKQKVIYKYKQYEKFDLVLFGGLFDYLTDKQIKFVLNNSYQHLSNGGEIMFTNIAKNNPFKNWIEICGNWELTERSNVQNLEICKTAGIPEHKINQYRDLTNLTNIVEIRK